MNERKKLNGHLSVSRISSNDDRVDNMVHIQLEDDKSSCNVINIYMNITEFGKVITGLSYVDCTFELNTSGVVGKKRENKTELIFVEDDVFSIQYGKNYSELLKPYEVDGWEGREEDLHNHHNHVKKDKKNYIRVSFTRFLDD